MPASSSPTLPKKRKQPKSDSTPDGAPRKKARTEESAEVKKKDKGKARERSSPFQSIQASLVISIPPVFANNTREGAEEMLDSMLMRYIPALRGVVLAHSNLQFLSKNATIKNDCPFLVCKITFEVVVWSPHVGMKLEGKINLCSPDHIALLVHRTFNVSIPRNHIPLDWSFQYGPAENDPEFGPAAAGDEQEDLDGEGRWLNEHTGESLGGEDGRLEFTVIGVTVANEMLSLIGSIQEDPFSPRHQILPGSQPKKQVVPDVEESVADEIDDIEEDIEDSEEDIIETMGTLTQERTAILEVEEEPPEPQVKKGKRKNGEKEGKKGKKGKKKKKQDS